MNVCLFLLTTTAQVDYTSLAMEEVIFQPGISIKCLNISTLPDDILEVNETFSVLLETRDQDVNLELSTTAITIQNDDSE